MFMRRHYWLACLFLAFLCGCDESDESTAKKTEDDVPNECSNKCDGGPKCVGDDAYKVCEDSDGDGCKEWSEPRSCKKNQTCRKGSCIDSEEPEPSCKNTCEGTSRCADENSYQICTDGDGDGCNEWSEPQNCEAGQTCQDDSCKPAAASCTNTCEGAPRCAGEHAYQTCEDTNDDGCKEWSAPKNCPDGEVCSDGQCNKIEPLCTNVCSQEGETQCSENNIETCSDYNQDGCLEWGNPVSCEYGCSEKQCSKFPECPKDAKICPKAVLEFNEWIDGDTSKSSNVIKNYSSCHDVGTTKVQDESGPEEYYMVNLDEPGFLVVNVKPEKKVDVDVHILSALDGSKCLARGDLSAGTHLDAGIHYISVDTFESSSNAGVYHMRVYFIPDSGKCGMVQKIMERTNDSTPLQMPVVGKVGRESHLATTYDQQVHGGDKWWPKDAYDQDSLKIHKNHTIEMYGDVISYGNHEGDNKWCSCNGSGQCGHASYGKALPPDAEAWDVNMYWKKSTKPPAGTRYLVFNPLNGRAVVAAAGYETGPRNPESMGGAVPEIHNYFGTQNGYALVFGELKNQDYAYGPIDCFAE